MAAIRNLNRLQSISVFINLNSKTMLSPRVAKIPFEAKMHGFSRHNIKYPMAVAVFRLKSPNCVVAL